MITGFAAFFLVGGAATGIVSVLSGVAERTRSPEITRTRRRDRPDDHRKD